MFSEIVRVDGKGRITLPATLRLLLDINEGERLILVFNEDGNKIEIYLPKMGKVLVCVGEMEKGVLTDLLRDFNINTFSCRCKDDLCSLYWCKILVELNTDVNEFMRSFPNIKCMR